MRNTHMAMIATLILLLLIPLSLSAITLDEIIQTAYSSSEEMKRYELDRENTTLTVSMAEAEEEMAITVSSGDVSASYDPVSQNYTYGTTGTQASFTLPNDGKTNITVSTGPVSYTSGANSYALRPTVTASHTLLYGEDSDNRSTLLNKQNSLVGSYTYQSNRLQFETSILNQISSLLTNEKNINETKKNIVVQEKRMSDVLALKTLSKESVAYGELENSMNRLKTTLSSLEANQKLLENQYTQLTSLSWEGIPTMEEPDLAFEGKPEDNASVALKALALDLAKEDLKLAKAALSNKSLKVGGGTGVSAYDTVNPALGRINGINANIGADYIAPNYSFGASFNGSYDIDSNDFSPTLTVRGSWNNNTTGKNDALNIQKLENSVMLAQLDYDGALQEYRYSVSSLQSRRASWQLDYALLQDTASYHLEALAQQEALFAKGLTTQSEVDLARFSVGQDAYEKALVLIEGKKVENSIRNLQIQGR